MYKNFCLSQNKSVLNWTQTVTQLKPNCTILKNTIFVKNVYCFGLSDVHKLSFWSLKQMFYVNGLLWHFKMQCLFSDALSNQQQCKNVLFHCSLSIFKVLRVALGHSCIRNSRKFYLLLTWIVDVFLVISVVKVLTT